MFILPDEYLESMSCDICHKFLSVGPVKVYRNRRIKCGRCSRDNDGGVVSQYGLVVEQGVFKCVNRFDGCRKLLTYAQVSEHEAICFSKSYVCPVCPRTKRIPTFLLIKHFKECHKHCILKTPSFRVDIIVPCTKTYLYRVQDILFFIEFNNNSLDSISLNAILLGHQAEDTEVTQEFTVYFGDDPTGYETTTKKCLELFEGFMLKKPKIWTEFVFVAFHLKLGSLEAASGHNIEQKKGIGFPRAISLAENCESEFSSVSTSILVRHSKQNQSKYVMYCINCSDPIRMRQDTFQLIEIKPKVYHFVCVFCVKYYIRELPNIKIIHEPNLFLGLGELMKFSCVWRTWGCLESNSDLSSLRQHETKCPYQPPQPCPVPNCSYSGKLWDLEKHSSAFHQDNLIITVSFFFLPRSSFIPETKRYYLWAYHGFVAIEVCENRTSWQISLIPQEAKENIDRPQPRALICEHDNFSTFVIYKNRSHISKAKRIGIRCFFEC